MKTLLPLFTALALVVHSHAAEDATPDVWASLAAYEMGDSPKPPTVAAEKLITSTPLDERGPIEDKLIGIIASPQATPESKWFACRMLQRIGTEKCIPTLAPLLADPVMSHYACLTLERFPESRDAGKALLEGLKDAPDEAKIGILGSLGERGSDKAVRTIAKLTEHENAAVARAALEALGEIGGKRALSAIVKTDASAETANARWDAMISVATEREDDDVLEDVFETATSDAHRGAALRGILLADEEDGAEMIADIINNEESQSLRNAALSIAARHAGPEVMAALAEGLSDIPLDRQPRLIALLGQSGQPGIRDTLEALIISENDAVADAAIRATAMLGDGSTAQALLAQAEGPRRDIFIEAVAGMTAPDVTQALIDSLKDGAVSTTACLALAKRGAAEAVPALTAMAGSDDAPTRSAAWSALGTVAGDADLKALMEMTVSMQDKTQARAAKGALMNVFSRAADKQAASKVIGGHYATADDETRMFILDVAAAAGAPEGLTHVRSALASGNAALYDKAVRALVAWSQYQHACDDLISIAKDAKEDKTRIVALRGYISQATKERHADKLLKRLDAAVPLAKRAEEKRLIIATAGRRNEADFVPMMRAFAEDADVAAEARLSLLNKADHFIKSKKVPDGLTETLKFIVGDPASPPDQNKRAQAALDKISG